MEINMSLVYIPFIIIFLILAIEDFKTLYIDIRLCAALLCTTIFPLASGAISPDMYIYNAAAGLFFMIFMYVLGMKIYIIKPDLVSHGDDLGTNLTLTHTVKELGFIPSVALGWIIYIILDMYSILDRIKENSDIFLGDMKIYLILLITIYILLKILYLLYKKEAYSSQNVPVISKGVGEGDVLVLAVSSSLLNFSDFLIIIFISMLVHLFFYLCNLFRGRI